MKRKKILSILLASAMIGTAPASAWAADFTDTNVVDAEEVTEEATEEDVPEQQEDAQKALIWKQMTQKIFHRMKTQQLFPHRRAKIRFPQERL